MRLMGRVDRIPTSALLRLLHAWPALDWRPALLLRRVVLLALTRVKEDEDRPVVPSSGEDDEPAGSMDAGGVGSGEYEKSRLQVRPHEAISLVRALAAMSYRSEPVCALLKAVLTRTLKLHRSSELVFSVRRLASLVWSCARLKYRRWVTRRVAYALLPEIQASALYKKLRQIAIEMPPAGPDLR